MKTWHVASSLTMLITSLYLNLKSKLSKECALRRLEYKCCICLCHCICHFSPFWFGWEELVEQVAATYEKKTTLVSCTRAGWTTWLRFDSTADLPTILHTFSLSLDGYFDPFKFKIPIIKCIFQNRKGYFAGPNIDWSLNECLFSSDGHCRLILQV